MIGLIATLLVVIVAPTPSAAIEDVVGFKATLPVEVAGGQWLLTTYGGVNEELPITLGAGDVPTSGTISIDVPLSQVAASTNHYYVLRALKPIDRAHGLFASTSQGLLASDLVAGAAIELGHAAAHETLINEAQAAVPLAPEGANDADLEPQLPAVTEAVATIAQAPTYNGVLPVTAPAVTDPTQPQPNGVAPSVNCNYSWCERDGGPSTGGGNTDHSPKCSAQWYGANDCLIDWKLHTGTLAFRGYGQRPVGTFDTFQVDFSNVQKWDNAVRLSSGPFHVDGNTMRQYTREQHDVWDERGDCWNPPLPGDRNCATDATEGNWGMDTWRWERHQVWYCSGSGYTYCNYVYDERFREISYDGGNEVPSPGSPGNSYYYERPSQIKAGAYGSYAKYGPATEPSTFALEKQQSYSRGATVTVSSNKGWGSASFSSTMTNTTTNRTVNVLTLRTDLPWMPRGTDTVGGRWYRYDNQHTEETKWLTEYWSCEWGAGWTGGAKCWEKGA